MKTIKIRGSDFSFLSVLFIFAFCFTFIIIVDDKSIFVEKSNKVEIELHNTKFALLTEQVDKSIDLLNFNIKKRNCLPKQSRD